MIEESQVAFFFEIFGSIFQHLVKNRDVEIVAKGEGAGIKIRIPLKEVYDIVRGYDILGKLNYNYKEMREAFGDHFSGSPLKQQRVNGNVKSCFEIDASEIREKMDIVLELN